MKISNLIQSAVVVNLAAACCVASADVPAPANQDGAIVVHGATPTTPVAPAWVSGHAYHFGDLANYDGVAFKAKSGSAHKRPDVASEDGWERLNDCDDKSKGAVKCEVGNQAATVDLHEEAKQQYDQLKQDVNKGRTVYMPD